MIVFETSAIVAIIQNEPSRSELLEKLASAKQVVVSAMSRYEAMIVLRGKGYKNPLRDVDDILCAFSTKTIPFDQDQATLAFQAYARFGKGSGSKAKLNLADCAAYALAVSRDVPLLFVGTDFAHTDVVAA